MQPEKQPNYIVHPLLSARAWQNRPQFDQVWDWRRNGGLGVCALVGMGGAGKTAIANRFLDDLLSGVGSSTQQESPNGPVFVYSFYEDDKPENFFRHLQIWIEGDSSPNKQKSPTQLMFDVQQKRGLVIMDGLEKVQESRAQGSFGGLISPFLRQFLKLIACGSARKLSVLATTRFPLNDLRDSLPQFYQMINVDQLELPACIDLLRSRGVLGSDMQIETIVENCGRHALTIDLAGGFIKEFGEGDSSTILNLGTADELHAEVSQEPDDDKRAVLMQGIRFARIAQRYREALLEEDEAILKLLERICLFRLVVDCENLAAIFTGPEAEIISGKALASLNVEQLQNKLDWLVKMGIVEANPVSDADCIGKSPSTFRYNVHPAVKDGFVLGIGLEAKSLCHNAIGNGLEVSLGVLPSDSNSHRAAHDLREEIIFHLIQSGKVNDAWRMVYEKMGGFEELIHLQGAYERAIRICQLFRNEKVFSELPISVRPIVGTVWAILMKNVGRVVDAISAQSHSVQMRMDEGSFLDVATGTFNLSTMAESAGHLRYAKEMAQGACLIVKKIRNSKFPKAAENKIREIDAFAHNQLATVSMLCGDICSANRLFSELSGSQANSISSVGMNGNAWIDLQIKLGCTRDITEKAFENWATFANIPMSESFASYLTTLAQTLGLNGNGEEAEQMLIAAFDWAVAHDARETKLRILLFRRRIDINKLIQSKRPTDQIERSKVKQILGQINEGIREARDCGYGLYHIDLLLERARLFLFQGKASFAIDDVEVALNIGVPANEETNQPELLAAEREECGYVWATPVGLQLRGEAMLLQAAQQLGSDSFVPARVDELPVEIVRLIYDARRILSDALEHWRELRDPSPDENSNFELDEKTYNYRAAETNEIIEKLSLGQLTSYPLSNHPCEKDDVRLHSCQFGDAVKGLNKIANCGNVDRAVDVVFVHGLDGDAISTWHPENDHDKFWPAWLGEDFPNAGIWSLGYAVASSAWKGHSMPLMDRATHTLDIFELDGLGARPIVFVCHSLGGLLVKQVLRNAKDSTDQNIKAIAEQTKVIVFLSTPHSGADIANWAKHIGIILRSTVSVEELAAHHPRLRELNDWYRNHFGEHVKTFVYCEKLKTKGVLVVNETSANPGIAGVQPVPLDEDHVSICKPTDRDSQVFRRVKRLIEAEIACGESISLADFDFCIRGVQLDEFTRNEELVRHAIASFLGVHVTNVTIASRTENSVRITLVVPERVLPDLVEAVSSGSPELTQALKSALSNDDVTLSPISAETEESINKTEPSGESPKRFNVALSFPGEHRGYVEEVANSLAGKLTKAKVFYDRFFEAELSRPNLDTYLQRIYHDDSELVVVILCEQYDEKEWCGLEFRAIRDLIKQRRDEEIMFVRVAKGDVKGVFDIDGYVDAEGRPANEIAAVILERLKLVQSVNPN